MKFVEGQTPEWKGKPKSSSLDNDADFQKLVTEITSGSVKHEGAGLYIDEVEDGKRLAVKNPARMVRDHLNRILDERGITSDFRVTCRLTSEEGVWAVWVTRLAHEGAS